MKKQTKKAAPKKAAPKKAAPVNPQPPATKAAAKRTVDRSPKRADVATPPQSKLSKEQQEIHPDVLEGKEGYNPNPPAPEPLNEQQLATLRQTFGNLTEDDLVGDRDEVLKKIQQRTGKGVAQLETLIAV